jgi:hypothetical protein
MRNYFTDRHLAKQPNDDNMEAIVLARFEPVLDRSNLSLEGQTSLHPIHTSTNKMEGFFEIGVGEPGQFDLSDAPSGNFVVYVMDLKSNYPYLDRVVHDRLDTRRFPRIRASIVELRESGNGRFTAIGDISFHGVSVRTEGEVRIIWLDDSTVEVNGEVVVDVRKHDVDPPKLVSITNDPQVLAKLKLVLKQVDNHP